MPNEKKPDAVVGAEESCPSRRRQFGEGRVLPVSASGDSPGAAGLPVHLSFGLSRLSEPSCPTQSEVGLQNMYQRRRTLNSQALGVTLVWKGYPGTTKPSVNNLYAI